MKNKFTNNATMVQKYTLEEAVIARGGMIAPRPYKVVPYEELVSRFRRCGYRKWPYRDCLRYGIVRE